jgi:hypothetical protein
MMTFSAAPPEYDRRKARCKKEGCDNTDDLDDCEPDEEDDDGNPNNLDNDLESRTNVCP